LELKMEIKIPFQKEFRIWAKWFELALQGYMTYRTDLIIKSLGFIIFGLFSPLLAILIYSVSKGIAGWSIGELLLLQGTLILVMGIESLCTGLVSWKTMEDVREGAYDLQMVRPMKPMRLATATGADPDQIIRPILGIIIIIAAISKLDTPISAANFLLYLFLIFIGVLFFYSLRAMIGAMSFWFIRTYSLANMLDTIKQAGRYPISIYGASGTFLLTFVLPVGAAAFYPASALIGRITPTSIIGATIIVLVMVSISMLMWHNAIKKYASAGG